MDTSSKIVHKTREHFDGPADLFTEAGYIYSEIKFPKKKNDGFCAIVRKSLDNSQAFLLTNYFVGIDRFPETYQCIYVEPKTNRNNEPGNEKDIVEIDYLKMLFGSLSNPELLNDLEELVVIKWEEEEIELEGVDDLLTPFLVIQFLGVLKSIVKKGLKKSYYKVERNLHNRIKGKVLVGQTIKQNHFRHKYLSNVCSYEEFGLNGIENRLLKKTLEFVKPYLYSHHSLVKEEDLRDLFNYINPAFDQVSSNFDFSELKKVKANSFYKEYSQAVELAEKILRRFGFNIANSSKEELQSTPPFWIDMSKLFEVYVLGILRENKEFKVHFQKKSDGNELDYVIECNGKVVIADAKYKHWYRNNWDTRMHEDLRQVSGYARLKQIRDHFGIKDNEVPDCVIIYPDLEKGNKSLDISDLTSKNIKQYLNISKVGVEIPIIQKV